MDKALELCAYRSRVVTTKQGLLDKILKAKNACKLILESDAEEFDIWKVDGFDECRMHLTNKKQVEIFAGMVEKLERKVVASNLFDAPEGYWRYVLITTGLRLEIRLLTDYGCAATDHGRLNPDRNYITDYIIDGCSDEYIMFEVVPRMLTIEEYSKLYGIQVGKIRQLIRNRKLDGAVKCGNEWRIPEIAGISDK